MKEKEKMISGLPYNPATKELVDERLRAKELCFEYNSLPPSQREEKNDIIRKLFGKTGESFWIESDFNCDYGSNIEIGENFYVNHNCVILDCAKVTFGENVFIGPNCGFYTAIHPLDAKTRNTFVECAKPITVGNNVWIGGGVTILAGVNIGDNVVIGAGSVVTKSIPSGVIAVGNPCKVLKEVPQKDEKFV